MAKDFARAFYNSEAWKKCRSAYISERLKIDGGKCEVCHTEQGYIVHHIEQLTPYNINNPDVTLNFDNLRYDCKHCHDREDGHFIGKKKSGLRVRFDDEGRPIPP